MPCASYLVTAAGRHIVAAFCKLILSLSRALSASMLSSPSQPRNHATGWSETLALFQKNAPGAWSDLMTRLIIDSSESLEV